MVKHKLAYCLVLLFLCFANRSHAALAGDEIENPRWWEQSDAIIAALAGISENFKDSTNFYNEWEANICPLNQELSARDKERQALFACIRAKSDAKLEEISHLNITIEQRNKLILELQQNVAFLELEIHKLNEDIDHKRIEITDVTAEYEALLGENASKAEELLAVVHGLSNEYIALTHERDEFRNCLEGFYGELQKHTALARQESNSLSSEICA